MVIVAGYADKMDEFLDSNEGCGHVSAGNRAAVLHRR